MRHGDLIFTCLGSLDDPISSVTRGYRGARVNHVGVVVENDWGLFVLEAFHPEVRVTSIDVHMRRSELVTGHPRYMIGRLLPEFANLIPPAVNYGIARRNVPYDRLYLTGEEALYCSELVVDMFKNANGGVEFFPERPMSFRDPDTGEVLRAWIEYYARFGMKVPEREPGSNPGDLSLDAKVQIVTIVGPPPGLS